MRKIGEIGRRLIIQYVHMYRNYSGKNVKVRCDDKKVSVFDCTKKMFSFVANNAAVRKVRSD